MQSHESAQPARAALAGIRVLDLADNAVAYASRLLADLGAEVVRIEPPGGSALRRAPPLVQTPGGTASCAHAFWNANKKAVTLDLGSTEGARLFGDLAARSDVVIRSSPTAHAIVAVAAADTASTSAELAPQKPTTEITPDQ